MNRIGCIYPISRSPRQVVTVGMMRQPYLRQHFKPRSESRSINLGSEPSTGRIARAVARLGCLITGTRGAFDKNSRLNACYLLRWPLKDQRGVSKIESSRFLLEMPCPQKAPYVFQGLEKPRNRSFLFLQSRDKMAKIEWLLQRELSRINH
jgi:hypothetical protein